MDLEGKLHFTIQAKRSCFIEISSMPDNTLGPYLGSQEISVEAPDTDEVTITIRDKDGKCLMLFELKRSQSSTFKVSKQTCVYKGIRYNLSEIYGCV